MPEVQLAPEMSIFHQVKLTLMPEQDASSDTPIVVRLSADGQQAGMARYSLGYRQNSLFVTRVFADPLRIGTIFQVGCDEGASIATSEIISVPVKNYKTLRHLSEGQIAYSGKVTIQFYVDGEPIGKAKVFSTSDGVKIERFYLPAGCIGYIVQYIQLDNLDNVERGYIVSLETDPIAEDLEKPSIEQP